MSGSLSLYLLKSFCNFLICGGIVLALPFDVIAQPHLYDFHHIPWSEKPVAWFIHGVVWIYHVYSYLYDTSQVKLLQQSFLHPFFLCIGFYVHWSVYFLYAIFPLLFELKCSLQQAAMHVHHLATLFLLQWSFATDRTAHALCFIYAHGMADMFLYLVRAHRRLPLESRSKKLEIVLALIACLIWAFYRVQHYFHILWLIVDFHVNHLSNTTITAQDWGGFFTLLILGALNVVWCAMICRKTIQAMIQTRTDFFDE